MKQLIDDILKPVIGGTATLLIVLAIIICIDAAWDYFNPAEKSSSFVGYSQSCWQVSDTLYVVTAKGDTVRLDVSKFR